MEGKPILITNPANLAYIDELYEQYLKDRSALGHEWQVYFDQYNRDGSVPNNSISKPSRSDLEIQSSRAELSASDDVPVQERLLHLITAYRALGHRAARIDPLNRLEARRPELDPAS